MQPETPYARLRGDRIAYQVLGEGPPDLVMTTGSSATATSSGRTDIHADLVAGSEVALEDKGTRELKGVEGGWRLFAVKAT